MIGLLPDEMEARTALLHTALDPNDPTATVVAWPGRRISGPLVAGDIIVRQPLGGLPRSYIMADNPASNGEVDAEVVDVTALAFGGAPTTRIRLHGPDRMLRDDLTILRVNAWEGGTAEQNLPFETPYTPPAASRPTIRQGSRGPAVTDAQQRLNRIDSNRLARGQSGIDRCPLVVDGIFGPNTRAATVSFQKLAFAGQPREWDGIIGPKTWAQLDAWSLEQPITPPPPTPAPPPPVVPIIPVVDRPLDPERWGPLLRPLLSPDAVLRSGNAVRSLIDGRETFEQMEIDINAAKGKSDYVYLLGWDRKRW